MKKRALITGASSGIGREFARIHAEKGGDLVIVARSEDKLNSLKKELFEKYGTEVKVIVKDLSRSDSAREIYDEVINDNIEVDFLINNAGFGGRGLFYERDWEKDLAMISVNVIALTALTRFFLPRFVKRNSGRILNVSSTAGLLPGPLQAVYFATKAYVTSFSNAIAEELAGTNVTVTALLPGATATEFSSTAGLEKTDLFKKAYSPFDVALKGYDGMLKGKLNVIAGVGIAQRIQLALIPFSPKKIVLKQMKNMQKIRE